MNITIANCKKYRIDPNSLAVLKFIDEGDEKGYEWLKGIIETNEIVDCVVILLMKGLITRISPEISRAFNNLKVVKKLPKSKDEVDPEFESFVNEYYDCWPKGVKSGGYAVRSGKPVCAKNLKKFIKETGYSYELILNATKEYVIKCKQNNYQYMRLAPYFIAKEGTPSGLASFCEELLSGISYDKSSFSTEV